MTSEQLQALAAPSAYQPFMWAYALATGAADPDEATTRDGGPEAFVAAASLWNREAWMLQAEHEGFTGMARVQVFNRSGAHERHLAFMAGLIPDAP